MKFETFDEARATFLTRNPFDEKLSERRIGLGQALTHYLKTEPERRVINPRTALRFNQIPCFQELAGILASEAEPLPEDFLDIILSTPDPDNEDSAKNIDEYAELAKGPNGLIYNWLTMGFGKTVMIAKMIDASYRYSGEIPKVIIATQDGTLMRHFYDSFKRFTPDFFQDPSQLVVGRYNQDHKQPDAQILITSPESIVNLVNEGKIDPAEVDYLFLDEADIFTSLNRTSILAQFTQTPIISFSGTIGFDERQNLDYLGFKRGPTRSFNDAYEDGSIVRCKLLESRVERETDVVLEYDTREDAKRDYYALEKIARKMYREDAKKWAFALDDKWTDPETTKRLDEMQGYASLYTIAEAKEYVRERNERMKGRYEKGVIPTAFMDGTMTQAERDKIIKLCKAGKIRELVLVNLGMRGLDIPQMQYMKNLRGSTSTTFAAQRFGRITRLNDEDPGKIGYAFDCVPSYLIRYEMKVKGEDEPFASGEEEIDLGFVTAAHAIEFMGYEHPKTNQTPGALAEELKKEEDLGGDELENKEGPVYDVSRGKDNTLTKEVVSFAPTTKVAENIAEVMKDLPEWDPNSDMMTIEHVQTLVKADRELANMVQDFDLEVGEFLDSLRSAVHIKDQGYKIKHNYPTVNGKCFRTGETSFVFALFPGQDENIKQAFKLYMQEKRGQYLTPDQVAEALFLTKEQEVQFKKKLKEWRVGLRRHEERTQSVVQDDGNNLTVNIKLMPKGSGSNNQLCVSEHSLIEVAHALGLKTIHDDLAYVPLISALEGYEDQDWNPKALTELYNEIEEWLDLRDSERRQRETEATLRYEFAIASSDDDKNKGHLIKPFQLAARSVMAEQNTATISSKGDAFNMRYKYLWDPVIREKVLCLSYEDLTNPKLAEVLRQNRPGPPEGPGSDRDNSETLAA